MMYISADEQVRGRTAYQGRVRPRTTWGCSTASHMIEHALIGARPSCAASRAGERSESVGSVQSVGESVESVAESVKSVESVGESEESVGESAESFSEGGSVRMFCVCVQRV